MGTRTARGTPWHRRRIRAPKTTVCLALLVACPGGAFAFDIDYEIGLAAKRNDNINLSEDNPVADTVISPQLRFDVDDEGPRMQLAARGETQYLHYTGDTFDDELRGTFAGKLNLTIVPERMDFVVQDFLSRQPVDELAPQTPTNEQQTNVFVAGPSFQTRFSPATRGQLDLRYTTSHAGENEAFNGDRIDIAARVARDLTGGRSVSLNLDATRADFDTPGPTGASPDYNAYEGSIGYAVKRKAVDADIALGYTRHHPRGGGDTTGSALVRATFEWRISPRSVLTTTLRHQLTDATQALITPSMDLDRRNFSDFRYMDVGIRPESYRERFVRMRYQFSGERLSIAVVPYARRIRYLEDLVDDQDRLGALVDLEYRVRPRLTLAALWARERRDYVDIDRDDTDLAVSIGLVNRFTRHWTGRVDLQRRERDSTAVGRSYDANAVTVTLSYRR